MNFDGQYESFCDKMHDIYFGDAYQHPADCCYDMDMIRETFEQIVQILYGQKEFDLVKLDDHINYICHELEIDLPLHNPKIIYQGESDD